MTDQPAPDLEEARGIFETLLASKHHCSPALHAAGRHFLSVVLNEREAREEQEAQYIAALDSLETIMFGDCERRSRDELELRAETLASLPATESAQAEQPTSEAGS